MCHSILENDLYNNDTILCHKRGEVCYCAYKGRIQWKWPQRADVPMDDIKNFMSRSMTETGGGTVSYVTAYMTYVIIISVSSGDENAGCCDIIF